MPVPRQRGGAALRRAAGRRRGGPPAVRGRGVLRGSAPRGARAARRAAAAHVRACCGGGGGLSLRQSAARTRGGCVACRGSSNGCGAHVWCRRGSRLRCAAHGSTGAPAARHHLVSAQRRAAQGAFARCCAVVLNPALTHAAVDSPACLPSRSARGSLPRRSRLRRLRRSQAPALAPRRACRQPRRVAPHRKAGRRLS